MHTSVPQHAGATSSAPVTEPAMTLATIGMPAAHDSASSTSV